MSISITGQRQDTASPCIGICSTGLGDEVCRGCGRTFFEVTNWALFDDAQKRAINARLRLEKAKAAMNSNSRTLSWD